MNQNYWTKERIGAVAKLTSFTEMAQFGLELLKTLPRPIIQVCGPLSTGGRGSFELNLLAFDETIDMLIAAGHTVFDQRPFEIPILALKSTTVDYDHRILDEFYLPLFQSGMIDEMHFLPDWQSSKGATWEHGIAEQYGIKIVYLAPTNSEQCVSAQNV